MRPLVITALLLFLGSPTLAEVRTTTIDGHRIEYEIAGSSKVTVLFESGGGWGLGTWEPIFAEAAKTARVIRYSRVGFGNSAKTDRRWTSDEYAHHAHLLLAELGIAEPVVLVGHSYGGDVARQFAAAHPEETRALLLLDPASEHDVDLMRAIDLERANREIERIKKGDLEVELFAPIIYDIWAKFPKPDYPEIGDIPVTVIASVRKHEDPQLLFFEDAVRDAWGKLHQAWAGAFPRGRAVLTEKSGHDIHIDEPELVLRELRLLLARLDSPAEE